MGRKLFEIEHFSFIYAEEKEKVLEDISFSIEEGGFYLLCGRSGCGKSTLLHHFKSVLAPKGQTEGRIRFRGESLETVSKREQSQKIGFVFQSPEDQMVTDEVWHELAFGLESMGCQESEIHLRVAEMASFFGLESCFSSRMSKLSGGQKQLVNLASVLVMRPEILILDEPMAQLDTLAAEHFFHTLLKLHQEMGMTIFLSEHTLEDVFSYADQVLVMEAGKIIAAGAPEQIGRQLLDTGHDMFLAMPAPMRISLLAGEKEHFPYTVVMGKRWLKEWLLSGRKTGERMAGPVRGEKESKKTKERKEEPKNILEVTHAWFAYEKQERYILQELSLEVKKGEIFALLGGNGAGKSTLLRILAGFLPLLRGKVCWDGKNLKKYSGHELFHHFLGVLPQSPEVLFVKDTLLEDLSEAASKDEVENLAKEMGFQGLLGKHPYDLSGGERQKAALAKVLLLKPKVLLLDEPTKSLDAYYKREFGHLLRKLADRGITVLLVSHDIAFCAEYSDRAGLYFQGKIEAVNDRKHFFSSNYFYTTAANRMAGEYFPDAVTVEEVAERL